MRRRRGRRLRWASQASLGVHSAIFADAPHAHKALVLGLGRPCQQYNKAVELWRKDQKAQDDADKADTLTTVRE